MSRPRIESVEQPLKTLDADYGDRIAAELRSHDVRVSAASQRIGPRVLHGPEG